MRSESARALEAVLGGAAVDRVGAGARAWAGPGTVGPSGPVGPVGDGGPLGSSGPSARWGLSGSPPAARRREQAPVAGLVAIHDRSVSGRADLGGAERPGARVSGGARAVRTQGNVRRVALERRGRRRGSRSGHRRPARERLGRPAEPVVAWIRPGEIDRPGGRCRRGQVSDRARRPRVGAVVGGAVLVVVEGPPLRRWSRRRRRTPVPQTNDQPSRVSAVTSRLPSPSASPTDGVGVDPAAGELRPAVGLGPGRVRRHEAGTARCRRAPGDPRLRCRRRGRRRPERRSWKSSVARGKPGSAGNARAACNRGSHAWTTWLKGRFWLTASRLAAPLTVRPPLMSSGSSVSPVSAPIAG